MIPQLRVDVWTQFWCIDINLSVDVTPASPNDSAALRTNQCFTDPYRVFLMLTVVLRLIPRNRKRADPSFKQIAAILLYVPRYVGP